MKFNEAFDKAFDVMEKAAAQDGEKFVVSPQSAKIMTFLWNMMAVAQNKLDDFAVLDKNNNIISFPINSATKEPGEEKKGKEPKATKKAAKKTDKPVKAANESKELDNESTESEE